MDCVSDLVITNNLFVQPETAAIGHETVRPIRLTRKGPTFLTGAAYISDKREVVPLAAGG